jgi:hypothetical protein
MRAPRDTLRRPSVVLVACLFVSQAGLLVLSPILPELASEFGVSTAAAGQLQAIRATSSLTPASIATSTTMSDALTEYSHQRAGLIPRNVRLLPAARPPSGHGQHLPAGRRCVN